MVSRPPRIAPQGLLDVSLTPTQIIKDTSTLIESFRALQGDITSQVAPNMATFENVLRPQIHLQNKLECHRGLLFIYAWQPGMKKEYEAARQAQKMINEFETEAGKDVSMYKLVAEIRNNASHSILDPESQRYIDLTHANFIRNGAGILDENLSVKFQKIQEELRNLKEAFLQIGIDDQSGIWLSLQEVGDLPDNVIEKWERGSNENEGKLRLSFSKANISLILSLVKDEQVRRKIYIASENIHQENADRLEKILILRDSAARMIGFPNYASLKLEQTMAGSPQTVAKFIDKLRETFTPLMKRELDSLGCLKAHDLKGPRAPFYLWDWPFYSRIRNSKELGFDEEAFSEFFPLGKTVEGILDIFGELMGIEFQKASAAEVPASAIWHPEVELYSIWDADQETEFLGYLYLDIVERKGKSRGESHARINPGFENADGSRHYPVSAVRFSFPRPTEEKPTLLRSGQLRNLMHEIGHAIHNLVSRTKYGRLHGTQVTRDFAEIPSTLLESWASQPNTLRRLGFHYAHLSTDYLHVWRSKAQVYSHGIPDPPSQLPQEIIDGLLKLRTPQTQAKMYLNMAHHSLYDLTVHSPPDHDTTTSWNLTRLWNSTRKAVLLMDGPEVWGEDYAWGFGQAKFRKLITSYDVGFYSYPWSIIIAADLFQEVFKSDPTNCDAGRYLRKTLLQPGASKSEAEILRSCLGRDFQIGSFLAACT